MVPMPAAMPIALKNTVARTVISGPEQETFIIGVIRRALDKGLIDVEPTVNQVQLDTLETSSASINNASFEFKEKFFENIILQCNHLKKKIRFENNPIMVKKLQGKNVNGMFQK